MPTSSGEGIVGWRKSSASASTECVEVARSGERVLIRDSKDPQGPFLSVTADVWEALLASAKAGELDLSADDGSAGSRLG